MLLAGCGGDGGLRKVSSTGFFDPPEIDFGVRTVGLNHELTAELTNTSPEDLRVLDVRFDPVEDVFAARLPGETLRGALLERGSRQTVTLFYAPQEPRRYDTAMYLELADFEIELPIKAGAEVIPPAAPRLDPETIVFPETEVGRDVHQVVTITNSGETDGTLKTIKGDNAPFYVQQPGGGAFPLPSEILRPGDTIDLEVHYRPTVAGMHEAGIELTFDSGETAVLSVSGGSVDPGILTCGGPIEFGNVPRGTTVAERIECVASGGPYTLETAQLAPSSSELFRISSPPNGPDGSGRITLEVQFEAAGLADRHLGTVELVAAHGVITRVNLGATVDPPLPGTTDISVRLEWNTPWSDFDLHLVRSGGAPFTENEDCYFAQKNPDWGELGYVGDDPFLDRDDVDGFGPEEISLTSVGDADPVYDLYVQYHQYSRDTAPATTVEVVVQMRDQPEQRFTRDMFVCGNLWHVGRFRFDVGTPLFELVDIENDDYRGNAGERCR